MFSYKQNMVVKETKKFQKQWDILLIRGWGKDYKIAWVFISFFEYVEKELGYNVDNVEDMINWLTQNKLKRWSSMKNPDGTKRISMHGSIRGFVGGRSSTMSEHLFDSPLNSIDVLLNIDNFNWKLPNHKTQRSQRKLLNEKNHKDTPYAK